MSEAALTALTAGLMLLGLIGTLVPVVPDILLIWLAGLGYGLLVGWGQWGPWLFGLMTVFGLIGAGVDVILSSLGGRACGASLAALVWVWWGSFSSPQLALWWASFWGPFWSNSGVLGTPGLPCAALSAWGLAMAFPLWSSSFLGWQWSRPG